MKKLFGGFTIGWPAVIVFALVAGLWAGAMNSIPATENTSLRDIAISYEWWVIFAFIVATNNDKAWKAALKVFVFFAISQPVVFAIEIAAHSVEPHMAWYYYSTIWGPATLFTLPGGFIAYFAKKQNVLGCIVLGLACTIQLVLGVHYTLAAVASPPYHALSAVVCYVSALVMAFQLQESTGRKLLALLIAVAVTAALVAYVVATGRTL